MIGFCVCHGEIMQRKYLVLLAALAPFFSVSEEITINAIDLVDGQIPSGYSRVNVISGDNNWVETLYLPITEAEMEVSVKSTAQWGFQVHHEHLNIRPWSIEGGDFQEFVYNKTRNVWEVTPSSVQSYSTVGETVVIPTGDKYVQYQISDDDFTSAVRLPNNVQVKGDVYVGIASSANSKTTVQGDGNLLEQNVFLNQGGDLAFKYNEEYKGWHLVRTASQPKSLTSVELANGVIAEDLPALVYINIHDESYPSQLVFPNRSFKGQTIKITNQIEKEVELILGEDNPAYIIRQGDTFVFMYLESQGWLPVEGVVKEYDELSVF